MKPGWIGGDRQARPPGERERLLLGGDLPAQVVRVRLGVEVRLVEWLIGTRGEAHRARGAGVEGLLHARARRRLEHVARALHPRPDDVALGVAVRVSAR